MRILIILAFLFCAGCAKISFKDGEGSYWRLGNQKIEQLKVELPDGTKIEVGSQKGGSDMSKVLLNMTEITKSALK